MTRLVVGLTGGIGVGKSTVAAELAELGAHIIDVDLVCRDVIEPGGPAHAAVIARFGAGVVAHGSAGPTIDRAALAKIVFSDDSAMRDLVALSHPAANEVMAAEIDALAEEMPVVLDMAVLTEYPRLGRWPGGGYTKVLLVTAPLDARLRRLGEQRGMDADDVQARIEAQATDDARRRIADVELVNDVELAELKVRIGDAWRALVDGGGDTHVAASGRST